jgi:hypothetical protein
MSNSVKIAYIMNAVAYGLFFYAVFAIDWMVFVVALASVPTGFYLGYHVGKYGTTPLRIVVITASLSYLAPALFITAAAPWLLIAWLLAMGSLSIAMRDPSVKAGIV